MANIARSLIDDWERITVADPEGSRGPPPTFPLLNILWNYENEIIWSQRDQIISFSWDI